MRKLKLASLGDDQLVLRIEFSLLENLVPKKKGFRPSLTPIGDWYSMQPVYKVFIGNMHSQISK